MSYTNLLITSPLTAAGFASECDLSPGQLPALQNFENYLAALSGGNQSALLKFGVGQVQATGKFTFVSVIATDVLTINGVDFTCVANGATGNQFNVGGSNALTATAAAAAINASVTALVSGVVTALAVGGEVRLTAVFPGSTGNLITISTVDSTITPSGARLTGGSNGTETSLDLG